VVVGQSIATEELLLPYFKSRLCAMTGYRRILWEACIVERVLIVELGELPVPEP
jgi:hypothetical protein